MQGSVSTAALGREVGTAARHARREVRILAVGALVSLVVMAVVTALGGARIHDAEDHRRLVEPATRLADVQRLDGDVLLTYFEWLTEPDLTGPRGAALVGEATTSMAASTDAWNRYKAAAAGIPGERTLIAEYDAMVVRTDDELARALEEAGILTWGTSAEDLQARLALIGGQSPGVRERLALLGELRSLYREAMADAAVDAHARAQTSLVQIGGAIVAVGAMATTLFVLAGRRNRRRVAELEAIEDHLQLEGDRGRLDGELQRALELAGDEDAAYRIVEEALAGELTGTTAELLVADSSFAHVERVAASSIDATRACGVATPSDCPAVRRGQTQRFESASCLDACPQLKRRGSTGGAVCVPFAVGGSTVGVLHAEPTSALSETRVEILEMIARKAGERVGVARAFARSQDQALTDPLTGLLNRRSLEERTRATVDGGRSYAVIFTDLDHFKMLNDVHGHDAGDRALRLFSRCLRESARPADAVARYGGEEFVLVLPDTDTAGAEAVIERVRSSLERALDTGSVPRFTASFGVAVAAGETLADVISDADAALLAAKRDGRDRTVVWTPELALAR